MIQEKLLHKAAEFYIKNKQKRDKVNKIRIVTARIRSWRIPLYKNLFDRIHFRSYFIVLDRIVDWKKPKVTFEWGPGLNTELFSTCADRVYSVEHDKDWLKIYEKNKTQNTYLIYSPLHEDSFLEYPKEVLKVRESVDLAFIDGRCRAQCIEYSKQKSVPIVIMHDSLHFETMTPTVDSAPPRSNDNTFCKNGYHFYKYFVEVVDLRTVVLLDDEEDFHKTVALFSDFYTNSGEAKDYDNFVRPA